jgi:3,4-dihydroxy 2-butanone 4-phosphate synthase / GTP cyclohydrolase II
MRHQYQFNTIESAIADIREGKFIIVVDDEDRENEGDFIMAADKITPEAVNFFATHGRGLICVAMPPDRMKALGLHQMVAQNTARLSTRFTVSVDAIDGTTTGISAHDRALTIGLLCDSRATADSFARPGHVFPIEAVSSGVLGRAGHTEASVDLARLAGLTPSGVLCEILDDDGRMARLPKLAKMAERYGLKLVTVKDLIEYRRRTERLVTRVSDVDFPTDYGHFRLMMYRADTDGATHLAMVRGDVSGNENVLVRVHSSCLTGDLLGSRRCDCGAQLRKGMEMIDATGAGVVVYLMQEGRGIGLAHKIMAYALQDNGRDTVQANHDLGFEADLRDYSMGAHILKDLGVKSVRLLTNNPAKVSGLESNGIAVKERVQLEVSAGEHNRLYLATKRDKLGHFLDLKMGETA